jgi:hypothetical protein
MAAPAVNSILAAVVLSRRSWFMAKPMLRMLISW